MAKPRVQGWSHLNFKTNEGSPVWGFHWLATIGLVSAMGQKLTSPRTVEFVCFMPEASLVRERALVVIGPHACNLSLAPLPLIAGSLASNEGSLRKARETP